MKTPIGRGPQVITDADGRIDEDTHCIKCGYNLRTLLLEGRCPECGTAVGRSVHGDLLRFRDPDWVETLASGMNWILASIICTFLMFCIIMITVGIPATGLPTGQQSMILFGLFLVPALISLVGDWKISTPESAKIHQEPSINARKLIRITAVLGVVLMLLNTGLEQIQPTAGAGPQQSVTTEKIAYVITETVDGIASFVGLFAIFIYVRHLAKRIPDLRLAKQTFIVMWGMVVSLGLMTLVITVGEAIAGFSKAGGPGGQTSTTPGIIDIGACIMMPGLLVFGIWSLILIARYRRAFHESARHARTTWALAIPVAQPAE